jgi:surface antigen
MKIKGSGLLMMALLAGCGGGEALDGAGESAANSPGELMGIYANSYNYASVCPSPAGGRYWTEDIDAWRFYKCECTSYSADKLNERGVPFSNSYKGVTWGHASNWVTAANAAGVTVTTTPKVGDIAWWSGHVAYVESVNSDGSVNISEYNWGTAYSYGTRSSVKATKYIRF